MRPLPFLLSTVILASTEPSGACCLASDGTPVWLTNEQVIIVWDAKNHLEHFIRQADFKTEAKDFGFIVPTPTLPNFGVVNPAAFGQLVSLAPKPLFRFSCSCKKDDDAAAGGVDILDSQRVGDYQVTVVKATDGAVMNGWLKKNGYVSRPAMTEWLDYYAQKQWVFSAFKYVGWTGGTETTKAVRISFKTEQPHYPYRMPKDTWPEGWYRPLNVFFVSTGPAEATYVNGDDHWEAVTQWTAALPTEMRSSFAKNLDLNDPDIPQDATVTLFVNGQNPRGYDRDLIFGIARDWTPLAWIGGAVVLILYVVFWRRRVPSKPVPA